MKQKRNQPNDGHLYVKLTNSSSCADQLYAINRWSCTSQSYNKILLQ